jgi:hypothetical protein
MNNAIIIFIISCSYNLSVIKCAARIFVYSFSEGMVSCLRRTCLQVGKLLIKKRETLKFKSALAISMGEFEFLLNPLHRVIEVVLTQKQKKNNMIKRRKLHILHYGMHDGTGTGTL